MKNTLISIGDSLSQGFQSFAICDRMQRYSFPKQIAESNKNLLTPFAIPYIKYPGYPINIEFLLRSLENFPLLNEKKMRSVINIFMNESEKILASEHFSQERYNNLAIYGYTARNTFEANFNGYAKVLHKIIIDIKEINRYSKASNQVEDDMLFSSFNFSRVTHNSLSRNRLNLNKSQVEIAREMCIDEYKEGRECLITYWIGNNDILGALVAADDRYISKIENVLHYIKLTLECLLEVDNTKIVIANIPDVRSIPLIIKGTNKPIFPLYDTISDNTYLKVNKAVNELNEGLVCLSKTLDPNGKRLRLVNMYEFFKKLCLNGVAVTLENGKEVLLTTDFINIDHNGCLSGGGIFSLDGIHPTSSGYCLIANQFITAFNELGVHLAKVDIHEIVKHDTLINYPPKAIPLFLNINSRLNSVFKAVNLFGYIRSVILKQFNMKPNSF